MAARSPLRYLQKHCRMIPNFEGLKIKEVKQTNQGKEVKELLIDNMYRVKYCFPNS